MKKRIITGFFITLIYIGVILGSLYVHPIFFDVFIFLLAAGGTYEMVRAMSHMTSPAILVLDMVSVVAGFGAFWFGLYFFKSCGAGMTAYYISLAAMVIATVITVSASKVYVKGNAISTIFVMMYPTALLMFSVGMNYFMDLSVSIGVSSSMPYRNAGIALLFLVPTLTDILAYAVGSTVKGKKLCPTISPNKTISGAIGGLFGGMLGAGIVLLLTYFAERFDVNLFGLAMLTDTWTGTIINFLVLGLIGSVFDQFGDLFASFIKRRAGIKDFSNLLPGHGGVLDRVDGFIFSGFFFCMYFAVMILVV